MTFRNCVAVDLGASSGRVMLARYERECRSLTLREIHRFNNGLHSQNGYVTWDVDSLESAIRLGLNKVCEEGIRIDSIGIDTWGVDFVLLDQQGQRVGLPVAYRDSRTNGLMAQAQQQLGKRDIYQRSGIQFLPFNTLYQLRALTEQQPELIPHIAHALLMPDYFSYRLTGKMNWEYTNATTTQLVNINSDDWDESLLAWSGANKAWFGRPTHPGNVIGHWICPQGNEIPVVAVASHDTASAVIASPLNGSRAAYLSSGTWSLMGFESQTPFTNDTALAANITNEGGAEGRYRVLKNIMGLWLLQRVLQERQINDLPALIAATQALPACRFIINPNDDRFINPDEMCSEIQAACREMAQPIPESDAELARCIFDSLALLYADVLHELAKQRFAAVGIDVEEALRQLDRLPVSMHCWQGDDVSGFENPEGSLTGGIQATGNYPGKARNASELRADLEQAMRLIPGPKRLNLHAIYLESDTPVSRDQIKPEHFKNWVEWAKANQLGLDFNPSCFSHPLSADGFTLSHPDDSIRQFWIDHCKASRRVSAYFGEQLGTPSVMNIWIPDGMKDITVDRLAPRQRLLAALDEVISEKLDPAHHIDAVESKLFGIGAESYTVGSNEFYMGYATSRQTALCLDAGHFHPTEVISDKISAAMLYVPQLLLHVSRPVRWDSDHVVLLDDETQAIASEIVRHDLFDRVHIGLDFFDASINRIAAWVIGTRNMKKALLRALLEPSAELRKLEAAGDYTARLALLEEQKSLPWQAVWEMYCQRHDTPAGSEWLESVRAYEKAILSQRG